MYVRGERVEPLTYNALAAFKLFVHLSAGSGQTNKDSFFINQFFWLQYLEKCSNISRASLLSVMLPAYKAGHPGA
jgi:hypothetical protein